MENLFKFMLVRPPEAAAAPIKISVAGSRSAFLTSLEKLKRADASQKEMLVAAQKFADGTGFCSELGKLPLGTELEALYEAVTAKEPTAALNAFDANVKKIFGKTVREVAASAEFPGSVRTLEESIVAVKILSSDAAGNFEAMLRALRGVLFVAVEIDLVVQAVDFTVYTGTHEAGLADLFEDRLIGALAPTH